MIDRRLIGLARNPLRLEALTLLNERSAGVSEVAAELGGDPAAVGRELDQMHDVGLIEVVGEALNRGAVEPRYRTAMRLLWDDDEWAALGSDEQARLTNWIIELICADARAAAAANTFNTRPDSHASRTVSLVDEQGWRELIEIQHEALDAIFAVQAASAERLAEKGEPGFPAMSVMLGWEIPASEEKPAS